MPKALNPREESYVDRAITAGIQSTEILQVLVLGRLQYHIFKEISSEDEEYEIKMLSPMEIQQIYTEMKVGIQQVFRSGKSILTGEYIPQNHRKEDNTNED